MHPFDYNVTPRKLLTPEIVNMITTLHEYKGKQELYVEAQADVLSVLLNIAKIQSTKASNKIEGIYTSDERLEALVMQKSEPRNRSEEEIVGYREVLATIHESYEYIPARVNNILQLHRDLYGFSGSDAGGRFKNTDNVIAEAGDGGKSQVRFAPVPAFQTPEAMESLCKAFDEAVQHSQYDQLILIPIFVLDFLCIHPFNDGNGRMSRLLTLLLLYRAGYIVGKYISIELLIEKTKETYYETLKYSSIGWHEGTNDYTPFVHYYLGVMIKAYKEFQERVEHLAYRKLSKPSRIKALFDHKLGKIRKADIIELCPDISQTTIERTLNALLTEGYIEKVGIGRSTAYVKK